MSDDQNKDAISEMPVVDGATPPEEGLTIPPATEDGASPDATVEKPEALLKAYEAEKSKRKALDKEARELRKWREERERESQSDQERMQSDLANAQQEAADATAKWHDAHLRSKFQTAAAVAGMNPLVVDDVFIAQKASGAISVVDGEATGVDEVLLTLKDSRPIYFSKVTGSPGKTNGGSGSERDDSARLTVDEATAASWFKSAGVSSEDYMKSK